MEEILKQPINLSEYGQPYTGLYGIHGDYEILNPTKEETFSYVLDLLIEFKQLFPDEYVHLGMDEVYYACWQSNPEVIQFMKDRNFTALSQVEEYYVNRTLNNLRKTVDRKYQIWQDPFDNGVDIDADAVIQIWKGKHDENDPNELRASWMDYARAVAAKSPLFLFSSILITLILIIIVITFVSYLFITIARLFSDYHMVLSSCWYLNYIVYPYPDKDWERFYTCKPHAFSSTFHRHLFVSWFTSLG